MLPRYLLIVSLIALGLAPLAAALAQRPPGVGPNGPGRDMRREETKKSKEPEPEPLPDDKRLLQLHLDFVKSAEKLATEYERDKHYDKAKSVYKEILKLVPQYPPAKKKLGEMLEKEATADKASFEVDAAQAWQNSGIKVLAGKPVALKAAGTWTFALTIQVSPDGIQIPKELREFNLGCLVGAIDTGDPKEFEPFVIGAEHAFTAERDGMLMLRMYDNDPRDNEGKVRVDVLGTFEIDPAKKKALVGEKEAAD